MDIDLDELVQEIENLYSEANDNECTCYSDPERSCAACNAFTRAGKKVRERLAVILSDAKHNDDVLIEVVNQNPEVFMNARIAVLRRDHQKVKEAELEAEYRKHCAEMGYGEPKY